MYYVYFVENTTDGGYHITLKKQKFYLKNKVYEKHKTIKKNKKVKIKYWQKM